ncbi:citrate lyase holo-[acyl-carrier protein] synthase [Geosporobacter ferrireducens]|uniref:citrate lyase holo-[acyl-carrier protein] synthase n=1 Tax=Geosporobacter ferrireducens TaxID=1424294 RepID=A0A1D8GFC0_9FIRM|nr:citrate lyase holo-[acyl-carrier protein] synthase [Geosporobacter ferrireducens]AOT69595.1 holo-ACP synthase CitX [Geosporobacter ferrireducens]MTI54709.1 citrate lyase holo-[acyl-carrier protein] synthase [Geosporobacter ferrireducens]
MTINNDMLLKILESREQRAVYQNTLIQKHHSSLVSFTLNIPGPEKDSLLFRKIHHEGMSTLQRAINDQTVIVFQESKFLETGPEGYICTNMDGIRLKHLTTHIESTHPLGRVFDFDVFDDQLVKIGRIDIGYSERTCLLCSQNAYICRREQNHSLSELLEKINTMAMDYFE